MHQYQCNSPLIIYKYIVPFPEVCGLKIVFSLKKQLDSAHADDSFSLDIKAATSRRTRVSAR